MVSFPSKGPWEASAQTEGGRRMRLSPHPSIPPYPPLPPQGVQTLGPSQLTPSDPRGADPQSFQRGNLSEG